MFQFEIPDIAFNALGPVAIVAITGLLVLIAEMVRTKKDNGMLVALSLGGLLLAGGLLVTQVGDAIYETGAGMIQHDSLSTVLQLILIMCAALTVLFSDRYLRAKRIAFGEFYPLLLWSTTGGMLMTCTRNLMMLFIGLEILSISLYVMAGMNRQDRKSEESAMKYFLLGAFASGFLLYGIALIYGATGSLQVDTMSSAWVDNHGQARLLLSLGVGLMLIGLGFKTGLVPFHQWTPDVYEGAPTNVTAFMATAVKVAAFGALWRVLDGATMLSSIWLPVASGIAILTMLLGNMLALAQTDVKRVLAYSSISHAGYILVAVIAHGKAHRLIGASTLCYYLLSYSLMTIGSFAIVALFAKSENESTSYDDLRGLWKRSPAAACLLVLFMLSLIGLPPLAGFFGKAFIFADALQAGLAPLAVVLAISSVISVGYYLRIALAAVSSEQEANAQPFKGTIAATAAICAVGVLAVTIFYAPLMQGLQLTATPNHAVVASTVHNSP